MSDEAGCPICSKPAEPHVVNLGLAVYAEDVWQGSAGEGGSASPVCDSDTVDDTATAASSARAASGHCTAHPSAAAGAMCLTELRLVCDCCVLDCNAGQHDVRPLGQPGLVHALRDRVRASIDTCASADLLASAADEHAASQAMCDSVAASCVRLSENIDALHAALDKCRSQHIASAKAVCAQRVKALAAVIDELEVSAGQLRAGVALGEAALTCGDAAQMMRALECLEGMAALAAPMAARSIDTDIQLSFDVSSVQSVIDRLVIVQVRHVRVI